MDRPSRTLRRIALERLASLSVKESQLTASSGSGSNKKNSDLDRLAEGCVAYRPTLNGALSGNGSLNEAGTPPTKTGTSQIPISLREFEVLLALCKAAPLLQSHESAERLRRQLSPYLVESYGQKLSPSPFFRDIEPSPWECLTSHLTGTLLSLGLKFPSLREKIIDTIHTYLDNAAASSATELDEGDALAFAPLVLSFLGFLDSCAKHANFWFSDERVSLISQIRDVLSENYLSNVEAVFAVVRNSDSQEAYLKPWKILLRRYSAAGKSLGAMLIQREYMKLVVAATSLMVVEEPVLQGQQILDTIMSDREVSANTEEDPSTIEFFVEVASGGIALMEDGAEYARSEWQQQLGFSMKALALIAYSNCLFLNENVADLEQLLKWLATTMSDGAQLSNGELASTVLKLLSILSNNDPQSTPNFVSTLHKFIVEGSGPTNQSTVRVAGKCLAYVLKFLPQDVTITTLNTLGHVLSSSNPERALKAERLQPFDQLTMGSTLSLAAGGEEDRLYVYSSIIETIVKIIESCKDEKMVSLGQHILVQRLNKVSAAVNAKILTGLASLALKSSPTDFKSVLQVYNKMGTDAVWQDDVGIIRAIFDARMTLAASLMRESQLYDIYLNDMLEFFAAIGDSREPEGKKQTDTLLVIREIHQFIPPLAKLLSNNGPEVNFAIRYGFASLLRDFWFNCALNGIVYDSEEAKKYLSELRIIALYTPPLVSGMEEDESIDSDLGEQSILSRNMSPQNTVEHKKRLLALIPSEEVGIRPLSHSRAIFLEAAYTLESFRAEAGGCSKVLAYFMEVGFKAGTGTSCMIAAASSVMDTYIGKVLEGTYPEFSAMKAAEELADIFVGCCHRLERVQIIAIGIADRMIDVMPSALCQKTSLFALLELLTLLWLSCLEEETDEYTTRSIFTSVKGGVSVELPDSYLFRRKLLKVFQAKAKAWVLQVLNVAPLDVKGLMQTYLSEFEDEGSLGHVSLGRSFAVEIGSAVPSGDQRLASIDHRRDCDGNVASDFVMQYTTRQAYRYTEPALEYHQDWLSIRPLGDSANSSNAPSIMRPDSAQALLSQMESKDYENEFVPIGELRDMLKRAAALVCRSEKDQGALIRGLVGIPFAVFSKKSINLGISLWTGVIHEKPRLQSRILTEIARNWEMTVEKKMGLFSDSLTSLDPFELKMEYAPPDKEQHLIEQQNASDVLSPHLKLLHMLSSHYHATRNGNPHIQKIFLRLVRVSLAGLHHATSHPLSREVRFKLVLFGLQVLKYSTRLTERQQWRLKDQILSAALTWFKFPPQWSFGGNKLQVKAEAHLLQDVANLLQSIATISSTTKNVREKNDLLLMLVENELTRLATWLYPLDHSRKHHLLPSYPARPTTDNSIAVVLPTAWHEDPAIAVQLIKRFQSPRLEQDIKRFIMAYPEAVVDQPDALQIMLGDKLSSQLSFQLKYLLYWAPVNPITATTYFLPSYANNAFILQYAMRALESHSIDVTFFYVPQIVQTLRYDTLGYVERFILETAKFSQLFAHQIIWNMRANAYKDEDSQIPDPIKPTLDKVMDHLVGSFSGTDKSFYEQKNQKIAEELAKINVDVGVYLPSNPDGVVIDIDRKSGKSLQSHAKAPFMATFRISKKDITNVAKTENMSRNERRQSSVSTVTRELWQAAIFKVGDDCRQDMLALQLISTFRNIFNSVGLDVWVFPYRVTATAPGCGVIDVLPNSISRDMLGRDHEMGLYDYFINRYGGEDSIKFQEARNNFVKSMAAYSVISYLLKFKDRHNGNIMINDTGHIIHIDFGFCFDIAPGGITFERAPFKLTTEMISVMGGNTESQSYLRFEELCIKSFLACRTYVDKLTHCVVLMLDSGLPCFKPETIQNFKDRFVLDKNEREAADFMRYLVKKSYGSYSTVQYDRFQHLTNGIPY
ncbi:unnamed protein product [Tuber melanosporum]|uniref:1-phosphatidylinositol 4-kinase n=1 Tax=Tuber melanosporum (strain Mel28) TaxID=656061 RepID=D5GPP1_TUBMM|nr:uncharacterized protein GSTUM_00011954001 [Tuber melanosporum]CAZ86484.1 unnamed protein product [Tuber melanosporum]